MFTTIVNLVMWLAGLFGFGKPTDPAADQRKADRQSGIDAAVAQGATQEVTEIQNAQKARQDSVAASVSDGPDGVRERGRTDPDARPFDPDAVG